MYKSDYDCSENCNRCLRRSFNGNVISPLIGIIIVIVAIIWVIYGVVCFSTCGAVKDKCFNVGDKVVVKTCQNENNYNYYPYMGYAMYCFKYNSSSDSSANIVSGAAVVVSLCVKRSGVCEPTEESAKDKINKLYPHGNELDCWRIVTEYTENKVKYYDFFIYWYDVVTKINSYFTFCLVLTTILITTIMIFITISLVIYVIDSKNDKRRRENRFIINHDDINELKTIKVNPESRYLSIPVTDDAF